MVMIKQFVVVVAAVSFDSFFFFKQQCTHICESFAEKPSITTSSSAIVYFERLLCI